MASPDIAQCSSMQLNAAQYSSMQLNAAQCSSMQLNAAQCSSMSCGQFTHQCKPFSARRF
jgi:hypothetical protein